MDFKALVDEQLIDTDLPAGDKFQVIEHLLNLAVAAGRVSDRERALTDLVEREKYLSTGFEHGLAVPHAKTQAVADIILVFGLSREGIDFDSLDGQPTHFIFLLLSPMDTSGPHIQTLALLARNFQKEAIVEKLRQVTSKPDLIAILQQFQ